MQSLDELVTALSEGERTTFNHIIHSVKLPIKTFEDYISWSEECYTRNCIVNNEKFELILLCWEQGQITPIHDHGGEECWVKVIEGEFRETIYKEDEIGGLTFVKSSVSKENAVTYMKDFMGFHSLENLSKKRSMSLHLYAKPIRKCRAFDEKTKTFVDRMLTYCTTV
ncbi:cysteine dioxygenase family protein [Tenacibaculum haliotis]|nr:cysteine dioxygenase family protein [Tenacibaculum haliotis]